MKKMNRYAYGFDLDPYGLFTYYGKVDGENGIHLYT